MNIAEKYIDDVLNGRVLVCEHVKNAVNRYINDRESGWMFSENYAQHAIDFIEQLEHTTGDYAGKPFALEGWQAFIVWNLFGFLNPDGSRRFTRSYIEVPRKNGKSTFSSAVMLYGLIADDESAAQVYSAATKLDQAMMVFSESVRACQNLPWLSEALTVNNSVVANASGIYTTGTVNAAVSISSGAFNLTYGSVYSNTLTTSTTTANQVLDQFAYATYRSANYMVSITSGTAYQTTQLSVITDGTTAYSTEYGTLYTGATLASFSATINGANLVIQTTPVNAVTTYKFIRTSVVV